MSICKYSKFLNYNNIHHCTLKSEVVMFSKLIHLQIVVILYLFSGLIYADTPITDVDWESMGQVPGVQPGVSCIVIDNMGILYAGGVTSAGGIAVNNIAKWNGNEWSPLGSGIDGTVFALACDVQNNIYAAGNFTTAGGVEAYSIAKWNGSTWSALDSGLNGYVYALAFDSQGNLYAGGVGFSFPSTVDTCYIAKWDGTTWHKVCSDMGQVSPYGATVFALAVDSADNLYAGGYFNTIGGVSTHCIARWDGSQWYALGNGMDNLDYVRALSFDSSWNLYAGGEFATAGFVVANNIAKWDGSDWYRLGSGVVQGGSDEPVKTISTDRQGNVYIGGHFIVAGDDTVNHIAKWNGSEWQTLQGGMLGSGGVGALAVDSQDNLYAGGDFAEAGGVYVNNIAKWVGDDWCPLASGVNGSVVTAISDTLGNVYMGGGFSHAGMKRVNSICRWKSNQWYPLGNGMADSVHSIANVDALALDEQGNLYAGGEFTAVDSMAINRIAKWNGIEWDTLTFQGGLNGRVKALVADKLGNVYAGGWFTKTNNGISVYRIAKWDGSQWHALGNGINDNSPTITSDISVEAIALDEQGNLYVGGKFTIVDGREANGIAKWNGTEWDTLSFRGGLDDRVRALVVDEYGDIYAGGDFIKAGSDTVNSIVKWQWNDSTWAKLGTGILSIDGAPFPRVYTLSFDTYGNLYAGGIYFDEADGVLINNIAKWNDTTWSALGSGTNSTVNAITVYNKSNLIVGGSFTEAGGKVSAYVAKCFPSGVVATHKFLAKPKIACPFSIISNRIILTLPYSTKVGYSIFSLSGKKITKASFGRMSAGKHIIYTNTESHAYGMYLIRLYLGEQVFTRKFIILKQ